MLETRNPITKTAKCISVKLLKSSTLVNTYVNRIVLLKLSGFLCLAHQYKNRGRTVEERVTAAFIGLPCRDKMREALLKQVLINFDLCHGVDDDLRGRDCSGRRRLNERRDGVNFACLVD